MLNETVEQLNPILGDQNNFLNKPQHSLRLDHPVAHEGFSVVFLTIRHFSVREKETRIELEFTVRCSPSERFVCSHYAACITKQPIKVGLRKTVCQSSALSRSLRKNAFVLTLVSYLFLFK